MCDVFSVKIAIKCVVHFYFLSAGAFAPVFWFGGGSADPSVFFESASARLCL